MDLSKHFYFIDGRKEQEKYKDSFQYYDLHKHESRRINRLWVEKQIEWANKRELELK